MKTTNATSEAASSLASESDIRHSEKMHETTVIPHETLGITLEDQLAVIDRLSWRDDDVVADGEWGLMPAQYILGRMPRLRWQVATQTALEIQNQIERFGLNILAPCLSSDGIMFYPESD